MSNSISRVKNDVISVRITPKMHEILEEVAEKYQISVPETIRQCVRDSFDIDESIDFKDKIRTIIRSKKNK